MKCRYVAIDIETTGLDPNECQVLEVAAVVETDWETPVEQLPRFHMLIEQDEICGTAFALSMNARILAELALPRDKRSIPSGSESVVMMGLRRFLNEQFRGERHITAAGKNVGTFDLKFLEQIPEFPADKFRHRVIDPGMLYLDPATDAAVPDTTTCLKRAGLTNDRPHHAVNDCFAVIELVRAAFMRHATETVATETGL